jgi:hypothetical protein
MSEQRFYITDTGLGLDTVSDEMYSFGDEEDFCRLFDKLNEQQSTIQSLKEENDGIKTKGLDVLAFYESKLKNVVGTEDFQSVRDEIWIVRQVLYEMGVINDE